MARVKLSALFTAISGRYGGGVFRAWKGLTVLSALPSSVLNPNSDKQASQRAILACASKLWAAFASGLREDWAAVAAALSDQWGNYENEVGTHRVIRTPRGPYTALGALTSVCGLLSTCELWDCETEAPAAPVSHTAPSPPTNLGLSGDTDGIVVTWTNPAAWGDLETTGRIRVWVATDDGTVFAQFVAAVGVGPETLTITEVVHAGQTEKRPLEPGFYYVQADAVNLGGLRGAPGNVATIELEDPVI